MLSSGCWAWSRSRRRRGRRPHDMLGRILNSETMNGTIRSMLGTMLQHLSALPVHMLRQVYREIRWFWKVDENSMYFWRQIGSSEVIWLFGQNVLKKLISHFSNWNLLGNDPRSDCWSREIPEFRVALTSHFCKVGAAAAHLWPPSRAETPWPFHN